MANAFRIFSGTGNSVLAAAVAAELGTPPGLCFMGQFPDGEIGVRLDESVRGAEVFFIQPTSPPVNDHLMELLAFADACRRSAAARITAVVPYFGYARSDKRHGRRQPITASLVAQLMQAAGIDHVVTLDLHAAQIEGFFQIPVDSLTAVPVLTHAIKEKVPPGAVIVSPDTGRVAMATEYAHRLGCSVAILHKKRTSGTETEVTHVVGDVRGHSCVIIDDMTDLGAQLPTLIRGLYYDGWNPTGKPANERTREEFLLRVALAFRGQPEIVPEEFARAVFELLERHISAGEIGDVKHVLPAPIRSLWPDGKIGRRL